MQVLHNPKRDVNLKCINLQVQIEQNLFYLVECRSSYWVINILITFTLLFFFFFEFLIVAYCLEMSIFPDSYLYVICSIFLENKEVQSKCYFQTSYLIYMFLQL